MKEFLIIAVVVGLVVYFLNHSTVGPFIYAGVITSPAGAPLQSLRKVVA